MTARDHGRKRAVAAGERHPDVASSILGNFKIKFASDAFEIIEHLSFKRSVTLAGHAFMILAHAADMIKDRSAEISVAQLRELRHIDISGEIKGYKPILRCPV